MKSFFNLFFSCLFLCAGLIRAEEPSQGERRESNAVIQKLGESALRIVSDKLLTQEFVVKIKKEKAFKLLAIRIEKGILESLEFKIRRNGKPVKIQRRGLEYFVTVGEYAVPYGFCCPIELEEFLEILK